MTTSAVPPGQRRIPPKRKARQLAKHLRDERPDYAYLKAVFRALRDELDVQVEREPKTLPYVPSEDEIRRYYQTVWQARRGGDMVLIKTLLYTGVRVAELVAIGIDDVDLDACRIRITHGKGGKDRVVPFPQTFRETLALHIADRHRPAAATCSSPPGRSPTPPAACARCWPVTRLPPGCRTTCHRTGCGTSCSPGSAATPAANHSRSTATSPSPTPKPATTRQSADSPYEDHPSLGLMARSGVPGPHGRYSFRPRRPRGGRGTEITLHLLPEQPAQTVGTRSSVRATPARCVISVGTLTWTPPGAFRGTTAVLLRPDGGRVTSEDPAARPRRRRFTAEYKLAIVAEYDGCTNTGAKGALLRREGLYSSHITEWRRASQSGSLAGLTGTPRSTRRSAEQLELDKLRRRNERLERELAKNQAALTIMGKAHELLELLSESSVTERPSSR